MRYKYLWYLQFYRPLITRTMPVYSSRPKPLVIEFLEAATGQYQEDFLLEDRSKLQDVAFTMRRHLYAGFALGVILGLGSAQVVRGNNKAFLKALRIHGIPSHVVFSNGRLGESRSIEHPNEHKVLVYWFSQFLLKSIINAVDVPQKPFRI